MKFNVQIFKKLTCVILTIGLTNCAGDGENVDPINSEHTVSVQLEAPLNGATYTVGNPVNMSIKVIHPEGVSELAIYVNDQLYAGDLAIKDQTIALITDSTSKVGKYYIKLSYKDANGKVRVDNREVYYFSDIVPTQKTAVIVATYPHAKTSYTQGLEFYKGRLFEGTGQYNQSILTEVDLKTGTKLREFALDGSTFGEGITILNDTIYQITYKSEACYVYDLDFNLIKTFTYTGEGWGLCNDGNYLIMSNGSPEIVWRDPRTFEIVKSIEVFDNQYNLGQLNELELVDGNIFVNIYTENRIAEIDTATGKVLTYINCEALTTDAKDPGNDVLNGIAYNPLTGKMYMTGKWWPKLYEVSFK